MERRLGRNLWPHVSQKFRPILAFSLQGFLPLLFAVPQGQKCGPRGSAERHLCETFGNHQKFRQKFRPRSLSKRALPIVTPKVAGKFRPRLVNFRLSNGSALDQLFFAFCSGRIHYQCVFTHLGINRLAAFKRQIIGVTVHCCC